MTKSALVDDRTRVTYSALFRSSCPPSERLGSVGRCVKTRTMLFDEVWFPVPRSHEARAARSCNAVCNLSTRQHFTTSHLRRATRRRRGFAIPPRCLLRRRELSQFHSSRRRFGSRSSRPPQLSVLTNFLTRPFEGCFEKREGLHTKSLIGTRRVSLKNAQTEPRATRVREGARARRTARRRTDGDREEASGRGWEENSKQWTTCWDMSMLRTVDEE